VHTLKGERDRAFEWLGTAVRFGFGTDDKDLALLETATPTWPRCAPIHASRRS